MAHQAITTQNMTDEQFDRHAMQVLARELGAGGLARFIRLNRSGPGDYTRDRHKWLDGVTIEDFERQSNERTSK
jgi:hypothetical protein